MDREPVLQLGSGFIVPREPAVLRLEHAVLAVGLVGDSGSDLLGLG